ncbi:ubiquitin carboxyl-terminal hydrolase [Histoplasma capsulatum var. duboisii H88]|uniref:Ubiquitin carboxyl-terminal hydrolase n=1 Tax=Ajellomyces capsulatus (strain H88) TaxID=544711 RepID=F0U8V0_AJEC8|nr:ubiquitin carboxyl-terminal hydrolase [Histoplasma capsulatum var. duboisii H88]
MAASPLDSSSTPHPAAVAVDPPGSPNDPMEDTYTQATRKRPRLDSGNHSNESMTMSVPSPSSDSGHYGNDQLLSSGSLVPPAATSVPEPETPNPQRPSSRVTINMKSPTLHDDSASHTVEETPAVSDQLQSEQSEQQEQHEQREQFQMSPDLTSHAQTAISITSSPSRSPEIEVAEVEDMDQDPSTSNWRSLEDALREEPDLVHMHDEVSLAESFPRLRQDCDVREAIEEIANYFERGHPHDITFFISVKSWLELCVNNLNSISYDTVAEDRDVWEEVPMLMESVLRRHVDFQPDEGDGPWKCLEDFSVAFGRLSIHMVRLDILTLEHYPNDADSAPDLLSKVYLPALGWILQLHTIPFYKLMERTYGAEIINLVARVNDQLTAGPANLVKHLSEFAPLLLKALQPWPQFSGAFVSLLTIAHNVVESGMERKRYHAADELIATAELIDAVESVYTCFRSIDAEYQSYISKKSSWVTNDSSESVLRYIGYSYHNIAVLNSQLAVQMTRDLGVDVPENAKQEEYPFIIHLGWKFQVLKRHITEGRMELRVYGMETMQADLVSVWRQHIQGNPAGVNYPIIQYLVKFLRDNKIVEYIVGVDSHPQLISRSGNVVGFLVVTSTYADNDTDIIWNTVTESQDPRTVAEVLGMLTRTFIMHQSGSNALIYLCTKLIELPLNRFDARMLEYSDCLLNAVRDKHSERMRSQPYDHLHVDVVPCRLCVRLIRDATSISEFSIEQKTNLQKFASKQLSHLLTLGMDDNDKMEMYKKCIDDISEMNEFVVGSIQALNALIHPYDNLDIRRLALDFDFTRLIITELAHTFDTVSTDFSDPMVRNSLRPRIQMLLRIIEKVPETITPELSEILWSRVFMSKKIGECGRSLAWEILPKATSRALKRNPFLECYLNVYLPRISPEDYTLDILAFAEQAVSYEIRFDLPPDVNENEIIAIPGMDRLWHFILTAPPGTIEMKATNFAIDVYLDHELIRTAPRSAAEATHVALVDRCVSQLTAAASKCKAFTDGSTSGEDEPMVIVPSDGEVRAEELRFTRSLLFLRQLLQGLRMRPQYTPLQVSPPESILREDEIIGEPIELSYQAFSGNSQTKIRTLKIGDLSTASELAEKLTRLTGFTSFSSFSCGQRLDLTAHAFQTLRDMKLAGSGLLMIRKNPDAFEASVGGRRQSLTLVDSEVLKHFDDLYDLLSLEEKLSKENNPDQEFVSHSIQNLVAFITRPQMGDGLEDSPLKLLFARNSVECLLFALTAKSMPEDSEQYFSNPLDLATRLLSFISLCRNLTSKHLSEISIQKLISNSFAVIIEASMHDSRVWDAVEQSTQIKDLIFTLLLSESRQGIRKSVAEIIFATCGTTPSQKRAWKASSQVKGGAVAVVGRLPSATTIHIVATLWKHISALFPDTLEYAQSSQEFFEVALTVFQTVANLSPEDLIYGEYLRKWGDILLSHRTNEFVGREPVDYIVLGFTHLLKMCLELSHATPGTMDTSNLMEKLFTTYLFPELSEPTETKVIQSSIPVMHNTTRQEIYNILLLLCEDQANCERMLTLLDDVIPYDYTHEPNWIFDRYKTIRSPEGYAGLKNLSNTCYLNSLFTQLFMNIDFRKFMIEVHVSDVDSTQKLLAETKKVFAYMQNTWQKSVDTQETVDTIRTYDNEPIDINVQMDVDEFYNLLFDRWEGQILSTEDKKLFRSFYGGQLVQQIKSKECPHISERLEPFSAIQCDIKGKAGLEDSLRAYVEGEVMQGDNKYSCTSCGRHVDAVKRACLKDLPDNLIFHLKRFDFDVISMIRSKINDEFQFPERLDMTPYTVEYLSNPGTPIVPDIFELVGVLVHSGTAESGHYYSYIRERPTAADPSAWVEFNDSDVSRFDPSKIPDQCFGGMNDPIHSANIGPVRFNKVWNAYMLFYQRVSSMERAKSVYEASLGDAPVSVPLPMQLGNHIALENEIFIRAYCLLDPYHAYFIRALLEQSRKFSTTEESGFGKIQKPAICLALDNLDQIISRSKELPEFENIIIELGRSVNESNEGAMAVLGWTVVRPLGIRDLLLKSPNNVVRDGFCRLLIAAVARLQASPEDESLDHDELARCRNDYEMMVENIVTSLDELWGCLHVYSRAWDDYFGLLLGLANFGAFPVQVMLEHGFLLKCLEMVWLDREDSKRLKRQYGNYFRLVEKGRKYSHSKLVEVLYVLMTHIDFTLTPSVDNSCRDCNMCKYSLTRAEAELVRPVGRNKDLIFLRKILEQQANPPVSRKIVSVFLAADPEYGLTDSICKVLEEGLRASPAYLCVPFLDATLVFCQMSSDGDRITNLIDYVSKGIDSINDSGGCEHLAFFQSLVKVKNEKAKKDEYWFWSSVVDRIPDWAPTLLHYPERAVRNGVLDFLRQLLFSKEYEDISDDFRQFYRKIGRDLAQASVDKLRRTYLSTADAQPPEVKSMETISLVIMHCTEVYFDERDSDDADFIQQATTVISALEQLAIDVPEELISGSDFPSDGWDDNSMMGSDSDVGLTGSP